MTDHTIATSFSGLPVVASKAATDITTSAATLNGSMSDKGNASTVTVSFEYGTSTSYGSSISGTPATLTNPGNFTANLTNLKPDTTYHFRAKATGNGAANGDDKIFTTVGDSSVGGGSIGGGGGGGPIGPTTVAGVTNIASIVNTKGIFSQDVYIWSDDK